MEDNNQERAFRGIWIPKSVWLNKELTTTEKFILAEIDSFRTTPWGCFMSNAAFGELLQLSPSRVSQIISKLQNMGYVTLRYTYKTGSKEVDRRYVAIVSNKWYNEDEEEIKEGIS